MDISINIASHQKGIVPNLKRLKTIANLKDYRLSTSLMSLHILCKAGLKCMPFFVSPELSSVRDYVITHSVRSM